MGEKFYINGTTTDKKITKVGVEIIPAEYWNAISKFAKEEDGGDVIFREVGNTGDNTHPTGLNLVRFNPDKTQSYQPFKNSPDYQAGRNPREEEF